MRAHLVLVGLFLVCGLVPQVMANGHSPVTRWDRDSALAAIRSTRIDVAIDELGDISSLGDGKATLGKLRDMESRSDWPLPAREAAIYQFTQSLAELPREAVATQVMQHLQNYQARTLVPHEDHADAYVPLFNIRGAAAGVENGWQRIEFAAEAMGLLETDPAVLVSAYARSSKHTQRSGYLDALRYANFSDLIAVQDKALEQLGETPGLTPLVAMTATITGDIFAIQQLLINGRGEGLSSALAQIDTRLRRSETAALLVFAIQQAPAVNATLAIAAWWPRLEHDPPSRDLLVDTLADPALGASAALALAQNPDIQTIKILQDTAKGDSELARRAQMALDFNRARLLGSTHP